MRYILVDSFKMMGNFLEVLNFNNFKLKYLVSFTIWGYTFLCVFTIRVSVHQVNMLMFYNVQSTKSTFVGEM